MRKALVKMLTASLLITALFVGVFSSSTLASTKSTHVRSAQEPTFADCQPTILTPPNAPGQASITKTGDAPACGGGGYHYATAGFGISGVWNYSVTGMFISSCDINVWIPGGVDATNVRYDFWANKGSNPYGKWFAWTGKGFNQNSASAKPGWYVLAVNLVPSAFPTISQNPSDIQVMVQNNIGGIGVMAIAAMEFSCTASTATTPVAGATPVPPVAGATPGVGTTPVAGATQ